MKTVELHGGHKLEIDERRLDNMELMDAIGEISDKENPNQFALGKVLTLILGKEGRKKLYDLYRTEDGRVPTEDIGTAIAEIFGGVNAKNC